MIFFYHLYKQFIGFSFSTRVMIYHCNENLLKSLSDGHRPWHIFHESWSYIRIRINLGYLDVASESWKNFNVSHWVLFILNPRVSKDALWSRQIQFNSNSSLIIIFKECKAIQNLSLSNQNALYNLPSAPNWFQINNIASLTKNSN